MPFAIVYPPTVDWAEPNVQRPHQLMRHFSRLGVKAVFCNRRHDGGPAIYAAGPNLFVCNDMEALGQRKDGPVVFWFSWGPSMVWLKKLGSRVALSVFDYIDEEVEEFSDWAAYLPACIRRADIAFAASRPLYEILRIKHPRAYLLPNAADYEHFARAVTEDWPRPPELAGITGPVVGFWGNVGPWVDRTLIAFCAARRPDYTFLIIGPVRSDVSGYQAPNIIFTGERPYQSLPGYARHFHAAVVPFEVRRMTRSVNPIKLHEYLAAGLPVVSTDLPECRAHGPDLVRVARDPGEFVRALDAAVTEGDGMGAARQQAARQNSWTRRVSEALETLERHLTGGGGGPSPGKRRSLSSIPGEGDSW